MEDPDDLQAAFDKASALMGEYRVPVVVEVILEKVTNISMGVEINAVNEFEELAARGDDAPTAITALLDYRGKKKRTEWWSLPGQVQGLAVGPRGRPPPEAGLQSAAGAET